MLFACRRRSWVNVCTWPNACRTGLKARGFGAKNLTWCWNKKYQNFGTNCMVFFFKNLNFGLSCLWSSICRNTACSKMVSCRARFARTWGSERGHIPLPSTPQSAPRPAAGHEALWRGVAAKKLCVSYQFWTKNMFATAAMVWTGLGWYHGAMLLC